MNNLLNFFSELELKELKKQNTYSRAEIIVKKLFQGKVDKGGHPYLEHLYYVSNHLEDLDMKTVGLLHDLLEDTIITSDDLNSMGFSDKVIEALSIITKSEDEPYNDYIDKILESNNIIAINVKAIDMRHNLDIKRIKNPTEKDYNRIETKYKPNYEKIMNYLKEKENEL